MLTVSAAGAAVYREVAPIALGYERELVASLRPDERATLDRILDVLTARAADVNIAVRQPSQPAGRRT